MTFTISVILMILLLSVLVLVHEAGHFLAARALGFKVTKFGFGLPVGPTLWSKQVGDVEVLVHAFLLGGYVSFPDDDKEAGIVIPDEDKFTTKPVWKRMIVISAGVVANIITAFLFVFITAAAWGHLPSGVYQVSVGEVLKEYKSFPAQYSELKADDVIVSINGSKIQSPYSITLYASNNIPLDGKILQQDFDLTFERLKSLNPNISAEGVISEGVVVKLPKRQDESEYKIKDDAMLKGYKYFKDDRLVLNQEQIKLRNKLLKASSYVADGTSTLTDVAYAMSDYKAPVNIVVLRGGKTISLPAMYPNMDGYLGISNKVKEISLKTNTFSSFISSSAKYLWNRVYVLCCGLGQLFTGQIPLKDMHGIIAITKIGGNVIQSSGFFSGVLLAAFISLNLAIINFLPIPALDGGHFMFLLIEQMRGKPLDEETINKISTVFFSALLIFMVLVLLNDVYALIIHKF